MSIKAKILSLVLAFALLAIAITALAFKTMSDYDSVIAQFQHASSNALRGERLNRYVLDVAVEMRGLYLSPDQATANIRADRVDASVNTLESFIKGWKAQVPTSERADFVPLGKGLDSTVSGVRNVTAIVRRVSINEARAVGNHPEYSHSREIMQSRIDVIVNKIEARLTRSRARLEAFKAERVQHFLMMAAAGIALLLAGSLWIAISAIASPLRRVSQSIVRISEGAYDTPIPTTETSDEVAEVWGALAILKDRAMEADRLTREELMREQSLRELVLD